MKTLGIISIIIIISCVIIYQTIRHLVATNKIKSSKVSKLFYQDDESFINSWEKTKEKGKFIYIIKELIIYICLMSIAFIPFLLDDYNALFYEFEQNTLTWVIVFIVFIITFILSSPAKWIFNQDRYNVLKEKKGN